jgi:hypothetical protein
VIVFYLILSALRRYETQFAVTDAMSHYATKMWRSPMHFAILNFFLPRNKIRQSDPDWTSCETQGSDELWLKPMATNSFPKEHHLVGLRLATLDGAVNAWSIGQPLSLPAMGQRNSREHHRLLLLCRLPTTRCTSVAARNFRDVSTANGARKVAAACVRTPGHNVV